MTFPELTYESKRREAAQTLGIWRGLRDKARARYHDMKADKTIARDLAYQSILFWNCKIAGYRRALHEMFD